MSESNPQAREKSDGIPSALPVVTIQKLAPGAPPSIPAAPAPPVPVIPSASTSIPEPAPLSVATYDDVPRPPERRQSLLVTYWRKVGAGGLLMSVLFHVGLLVVASAIVTTVVNQKTKVDFLPGGGNKSGQDASEQLAQQVRMKKKNLLNKSTPITKVVSSSTTAAISLPDIPTESIDVPELSSLLGGGVGSAGFGSLGFGEGMGIGGMSGRTFKPIIIFGNDLKARSIAVIMDVSGSMTPHLTKVVKELDRVAKGSPVVLYVGCGVMPPAKGKRLDDDAIETRRQDKDGDKNFEVFWRKSHTKAPPPGSPPPPPLPKGEKDMSPIPEEAVYSVMANRLGTYFVKSQGIQYAWIALLVNEVRKAEALYWFSDFQDAVSDEQLESVLKNLQRRKQKLFIHASVKGKSFEKVRDQLCIPSGGKVIESDK